MSQTVKIREAQFSNLRVTGGVVSANLKFAVRSHKDDELLGILRAEGEFITFEGTVMQEKLKLDNRSGADRSAEIIRIKKSEAESGPIPGSFSRDLIHREGKIAKPFAHKGVQYVAFNSRYANAKDGTITHECVQVIPREDWKDKVYTFAEKEDLPPDRKIPLYRGVLVEYRGKEYVLGEVKVFHYAPEHARKKGAKKEPASDAQLQAAIH